MTTDQIKNEFNIHYRPAIESFFAPLQPLRKAIVTFCYTTLWIVILAIVSIVLLVKIIGWYYHHKYMIQWYERWYLHRDILPKRWFDDYKRNDFQTDDDIFSHTEQYIDQQKQIIEDHINQMMNNNTTTPTTLIKINSDGTGVQQSISRISDSNGNSQWYTLIVTNNTINWTLIGTVSEKIRQWLQDNNITLQGNNFSVAYTPELLKKLNQLLSNE